MSRLASNAIVVKLNYRDKNAVCFSNVPFLYSWLLTVFCLHRRRRQPPNNFAGTVWPTMHTHALDSSYPVEVCPNRQRGRIRREGGKISQYADAKTTDSALCIAPMLRPRLRRWWSAVCQQKFFTELRTAEKGGHKQSTSYSHCNVVAASEGTRLGTPKTRTYSNMQR